MLLRMDPLREFDRLFEAASGTQGTTARAIPMDAVRQGDRVHVWFDLPGIDPDAVELTVERNQLTLTAERAPQRQEGDEWLVADRPVGRYPPPLSTGDTPAPERIEPEYEHGVPRVTIPGAERAKPRRVSINAGGDKSEP